MAKIVHAQTIIEQEKLDILKYLTRQSTTKDALTTAVDHYIECQGEKE